MQAAPQADHSRQKAQFLSAQNSAAALKGARHKEEPIRQNEPTQAGHKGNYSSRCPSPKPQSLKGTNSALRVPAAGGMSSVIRDLCRSITDKVKGLFHAVLPETYVRDLGELKLHTESGVCLGDDVVGFEGVAHECIRRNQNATPLRSGGCLYPGS